MRRKDRLISDIEEIISIMNKCEVLHLAMVDSNTPYVVPVNFGFLHEGKHLTLYIHGANEGRKIEILKKNPQVCAQMDCDHSPILGSDTKPCAFSYIYSSVILEGKAQFIENNDEKSFALNKIIYQCTHEVKTYIFPEAMLNKTCVIKINVDNISAKAHAKH